MIANLIFKPINPDYSALTENVWRIFKFLSLKLMIESELLSIRIILVRVTLKIIQENYYYRLFWKLILELINLKI